MVVPVITYILSIAYLILIISTVVIILTDNSNPGRTVSWLLVIMVLPVVGLILFYIFGYNPRRGDSHRKSYLKFKEAFAAIAPDHLIKRLTRPEGRGILRERYSRLADLLKNSNDSDVEQGSDIEIITSGQRKLEVLIKDIENARHHIHFEYFYFRRDENCRRIRELLMQKAREGVRVRFIYENIANIDISPRYYTKMREAGVEVLPFTKSGLPWIRRQLNYRDHRKIVVIDGNIGYTGGMNIGNDYADSGQRRMRPAIQLSQRMIRFRRQPARRYRSVFPGVPRIFGQPYSDSIGCSQFPLAFPPAWERVGCGKRAGLYLYPDPLLPAAGQSAAGSQVGRAQRCGCQDNALAQGRHFFHEPGVEILL